MTGSMDVSARAPLALPTKAMTRDQARRVAKNTLSHKSDPCTPYCTFVALASPPSTSINSQLPYSPNLSRSLSLSQFSHFKPASLYCTVVFFRCIGALHCHPYPTSLTPGPRLSTFPLYAISPGPTRQQICPSTISSALPTSHESRNELG